MVMTRTICGATALWIAIFALTANGARLLRDTESQDPVMEAAFRSFPDNEMARARQETAARSTGNNVLASSGVRFGDGQFPFVQNTAPIVTPVEETQVAMPVHKTHADFIDERMGGPGGMAGYTAENLPIDAP